MTLKPERVDFPTTWSRLLKTCQEVIRVEKVDKRDWNDRFSDVYKLCVAFPEPLGDKLYFEIKAFLEGHVKKLYQEVISTAANGPALLNAYHGHWLTYKQGVSYLNQLYMYLNTQHIKKQKAPESDLTFGCIDPPADQKLEIGELGLYLWKVHMIEPLQDQLVNLLLEALTADRLGNPCNESIVKGVILSFVQVEEYKKKGSMDLYQKTFEARFLQATGEYYKSEADKLLQESNCSSYMEKVLARLDEENIRSRKYLHPSSYPRVISECEARVVADHLSFLHAECKLLVEQDRRKDLQNMYRLLKPVESGLHVLVKDVEQHITRVGLEAVQSLSQPSAGGPSNGGDNCAQHFVESVLDVYKKYLELIRDVFNSDQLFLGALDKACSAIVNHRRHLKQPCRSPELLSRYCDSLLKKTGVRGLSETEIDDKLSASIIVFKYIDDKDVFQKFYAKMFAKRLIYAMSVSMEAEESMINKLKNACGYEFTSKLHRMYTDVKLSDDLNDNFHTWAKGEAESTGTELGNSLKIFNIFVLQAGAWPLVQAAISPFSVPLPFERPVSYFEKFYAKKFTGRKLTWLHHLSTVEMKMSFTSRSYTVSMGTYHMAILYLFESVDSLTYREMQEHTKLSDEQLIKHLQSLLDAKLLVMGNSANLSRSVSEISTSSEVGGPLSPSPVSNPSSPNPITLGGSGDGKASSSSSSCHLLVTTGSSSSIPSSTVVLSSESVSPSTLFSLNFDFTSKRAKFKITAVTQKEVQQASEVEQTHSSIEEDRKLYVQAAVVRIMKARKVIKHTKLVEEVIHQSKSRFSPSIPMIKKCIEALIEKGYLERTKDGSDEYSYIA